MDEARKEQKRQTAISNLRLAGKRPRRAEPLGSITQDPVVATPVPVIPAPTPSPYLPQSSPVVAPPPMAPAPKTQNPFLVDQNYASYTSPLPHMGMDPSSQKTIRPPPKSILKRPRGEVTFKEDEPMDEESEEEEDESEEESDEKRPPKWDPKARARWEKQQMQLRTGSTKEPPAKKPFVPQFYDELRYDANGNLILPPPPPPGVAPKKVPSLPGGLLVKGGLALITFLVTMGVRSAAMWGVSRAAQGIKGLMSNPSAMPMVKPPQIPSTQGPREEQEKINPPLWDLR